jgi:hypothetical protein
MLLSENVRLIAEGEKGKEQRHTYKSLLMAHVPFWCYRRHHRSFRYTMFLLYQALFFVFYACASALTPAQWRSQSIYQVITDRFARTDGSTSASCDLNRYCGGTWQGLINKLDYIQNMGFSAVSKPDSRKILQLTTQGLDLACCTESGAVHG